MKKNIKEIELNEQFVRALKAGVILQEGADLREVADTGELMGAFKETAIGGNQWAIQLHGKCQERCIIEGEIQFTTEPGCLLQKGYGRRCNDQR